MTKRKERHDASPAAAADEEDHAGLLREALAGAPDAARRLLARLYPVVQARVVRVLLRQRSGRSIKSAEVEDLVQEVFASLFEQDAKALRAWQPDRGLALPSFVGLCSERLAISYLRSGRRSGWNEDPTLGGELERWGDVDDRLELDVMSRDLLETLLARVRETLSPAGMRLFELVFLEEREPSEVACLTNTSVDSVYMWRLRFRKMVAVFAAELSEPAAAPECGARPRLPKGWQ